MTSRESQIYTAIQNYISTHKYPPSFREIAAIVGLKSTNTVHNHLVRIKQKGYITFEPRQPRTLRVIRHV